jgi:hypothetical protein
VFLGPLAESKQSQGIYTGGDVGAAWAAFADSLQLSGAALVVASYAHADAHDVTAIHHDSVIGTVRRRLDQLVH